MGEWTCKYCGKSFKTEKGFQKHNCEKKQRYENFNMTGYAIFIVYCHFSHYRLPENDEDKKMKFISFKYYKNFCTLADYILHSNVIDYVEYIKFLAMKLIPYKDWCNDKTVREFLYGYLRTEPMSSAIYRSENYLQDNNITLDTISEGRLFMALNMGLISYKYIQYKNFDYMSRLNNISETEKNKLKYFLEV